MESDDTRSELWPVIHACLRELWNNRKQLRAESLTYQGTQTSAIRYVWSTWAKIHTVTESKNACRLSALGLIPRGSFCILLLKI